MTTKITRGIPVLLVCFLLFAVPLVQSGQAVQARPPAAATTQAEKKPAPGQTTQPAKPTPPTVQYFIEAQLLPEARKLMGTETLTWYNTSTAAVDHLRFHLYYNAFRSEKTTFMQERKLFRQSRGRRAKLKYGEIKIKEMQIIGGEVLTDNLRFISPDDANKDDQTVLEVPLPAPVEPGAGIHLKIRFVLTIPQVFQRTGMEGDFFFMAQWFPKIGVLQEDGLWNCHQFHNSSEFFADYGRYKVSLTVPGPFVVGATGNRVQSEKNADGTLTHIYEEENIHDFAWTAYPGYISVTDSVRLKGNRHNTAIQVLLTPGHEPAKERIIRSLKFTLQFLAQHIFPYPYKTITVVVPPLKGIKTGGMEYPTLITTLYMDLLPDFFKITELVTIHEFLHQYWYGIVGSDEFREAWLDEGVTTFFEMEILESYFQNTASLLDFPFLLKMKDWEMHRIRYNSLLPVDKVNQYSWEFLPGDQYSANVYSKAGIFLRSLKNLVGRQKMYDFFKYYAETFKYKHPTTEDFIETFNAFTEDDFTWAFERYINGVDKLDHAVHSLESVKVSSNPVQYRNEVIFVRNQGYFPAELLVKLENQREIKAFWKDKKKWKKIVFFDPSPIAYAAVDPEYKLVLDSNFLNNSYRRKSRTSFIQRLSLKFGFFFQNLMGFLVF